MSASRANSSAAVAADQLTNGDPCHESKVTRRDLSTCLQRAMQRLGVQVKQVALHWKVDHAYVSRILRNIDPLPDHRIAQLDEDLEPLRIAVLEEWAADEGVLTARKAAVAKSLEALAVLANDDARLHVPMHMAKCQCPTEGAS